MEVREMMIHKRKFYILHWISVTNIFPRTNRQRRLIQRTCSLTAMAGSWILSARTAVAILWEGLFAYTVAAKAWTWWCHRSFPTQRMPWFLHIARKFLELGCYFSGEALLLCGFLCTAAHPSPEEQTLKNSMKERAEGDWQWEKWAFRSSGCNLVNEKGIKPLAIVTVTVQAKSDLGWWWSGKHQTHSHTLPVILR